MRILELWRYPVKSMAGEPLQEADLLEDGILGDRLVHVRAPNGRVVTSRNRPLLLGHKAVIGSAGEPIVDGLPWDTPEVQAVVEAAAGAGARLYRDDDVRGRRFDVLPLLVATDGAVAALGEDRRRLRPNILLGGVAGLAERGWEGKWLRTGEAIIGMVSLRERCVMTTFDPDTLEQDVGVLQRIRSRFGGTMALDSVVVRPGRLRVGDPVQVIDPPERGWQTLSAGP